MDLLESRQLEAFAAVAHAGSFTEAARQLRLTQPALSRRIQAIEAALKTSLFVRTAQGAELTEAGYKLSAHLRSRQTLEEELREALVPGADAKLRGILRIGGYSTLLHRLVIPALAPVLRKNPEMQLEFVPVQGVRPFDRQIALLRRSEVDLLVGAKFLRHDAFETHRMGHQELLAVESVKYRSRDNVFLDTRPDDPTTEDYFRTHPSRRIRYDRSFLHDEEAILDGVAAGVGRAIIFRSLLRPGSGIRPIPDWPTSRWSIYLYARKDAHPPRLLQEAQTALLESGTRPLA